MVVDPLDELDAQVVRLRLVADELRSARANPVLSGDQVELIEDGPTLLAAYEEMQRSCREQIRALDTTGVQNRKQSRSKYGAKRPK